MFKKLKEKIEEKRDSKIIFWKLVILLKDIGWFVNHNFITNLSKNYEEIFQKVYENKDWGNHGDFFSGIGSLLENTIQYRKYLKKFLKQKKINKVIDLGCGDFRVGKEIKWENIEYIGVDIVNKLIKRNKKIYSNKKIKFMKRNIIKNKLPEADLCIIKDILQHLPNKDILKILKKIRKYKYVLITEGITPGKFKINENIKVGKYRPGGLNLKLPPFSQRIKEVLEYKRKDQTISKTVLIKN